MPIKEDFNAVLAQMEESMKSKLSRLGKELSVLRTGRANPALLDSVKVLCYGQPAPIKTVAAISIPEARVIEIRPWDPAVLPELEKALSKADVGAMPQNDGKLIRLSLPIMTEERRKDLVKVVKRLGEEQRVALRNDRHDAIERLKKAEKAKELSQDEARGLQDKVQKTTDLYVGKIDQEVVRKEKEITTV